MIRLDDVIDAALAEHSAATDHPIVVAAGVWQCQECGPICEPCGGTGRVECWDPGGPCPVPNEPDCDTCGPCVACTVGTVTPDP